MRKSKLVQEILKLNTKDMTAKQIAEVFGVTHEHISRLLQKHEVPYKRIGRGNLTKKPHPKEHLVIKIFKTEKSIDIIRARTGLLPTTIKNILERNKLI